MIIFRLKIPEMESDTIDILFVDVIKMGGGGRGVGEYFTLNELHPTDFFSF